MDFRTVLRNRIMEILESWPAEDQYAIMFFIYPNECYEYGGYSNIPEFIMLYKRESDMSPESQPDPSASSRNEERWNPVFWWDCGGEETVISFDEPNPMADKLIEWYESTGVQNIGYEDSEQCYDSHMKYIDTRCDSRRRTGKDLRLQLHKLRHMLRRPAPPRIGTPP